MDFVTERWVEARDTRLFVRPWGDERHRDRLTALVLLDAGYRDPPFDPDLPYERYLANAQALARERADVSVPPAVVAAIENGIAQALPSKTRPHLAESGLPVLLVAAADASEDDLDRLAGEVPAGRDASHRRRA